MTQTPRNPAPAPSFNDDTPTGPIPVMGQLPPGHPLAKPRRRKLGGKGGVIALTTSAAVLAALLGGASGALITNGASGQNTATTTAAPVSANTSGTQDVSKVAAAVSPSVVEITQQGENSGGIGSGIILSSDGEILTNYHVISGGGTLTVKFSNGRTATATVIGRSSSSDLALVRAQGVSGLKAASLGDSSTVHVGDQVVAIGSPEGLQNTVTSGIVSALNRKVTVNDQEGGNSSNNPYASDSQGNQVTYNAIQTDASINPGNSGGPLVNTSGQIVGINSAIYSPASSEQSQGGSVGLGFAIPINQAKTIIAQMLNGSSN